MFTSGSLAANKAFAANVEGFRHTCPVLTSAVLGDRQRANQGCVEYGCEHLRAVYSKNS